MIRQYIKIAWRSLLKNRLFTFLNVMGLASGLAVALLLMLYVKNERSFDRYHGRADRIYRVGLTATFDGKSEKWANVPNVVGPSMKEKIPEVEQQVRWLDHQFGRTAFINSGENKFSEKKLFWADSSVFSVFDVPFVYGNPASALVRPNTIVLSESTAGKYFGKKNPVGERLKIDNKYDVEVTGVYSDFPDNSTFDANMIGSFYSIEWANKELVWSNASYETYVLLRPGVAINSTETKLQQLLEQNVVKEDMWFTLWLQPLTAVHLGSPDISHAATTRSGDAKQVKIITILAFVVLLIAAINYMNLSTAKSQLRFKEVSINKTVGASLLQLAGRFYVETALLVILSVFMALVIVSAGLPLLNSLAGKHLSLTSLLSGEIIGGTVLISVLIVFIAGSYPAFYLSSFKPKELLHTTFRKNSGAGLMRRSLVVVQFVASIILIISTIVFYQQFRFIQTKKLGYEPSQVVAITTSGAENKEQLEALINNCRSLGSVANVCRAQTWPGAEASSRTIARPDAPDRELPIQTNHVTAEFTEVLGIKLLAGQSLPLEKAKDDTTVQVVINRTAASFLGYTPEQAIGKKAGNLFWNRVVITGVMEDFHFESFHRPIGAYAFHNSNTEWRPYLLVKLQTQNLKNAMQQLEDVFSKSLPNSVFEYTFMDQYLNTLYETEQRTARIVMLFSGLAILIACLGLFGLAAFTAEQRTKEIGIRKVLGASVSHVIAMLSKDLARLVIIGAVIAIPVAWYLMSRWLEGFAYRITISWWIFVLAGIAALLIALFTISFQAVKAAITNPVKSLRSE